MRRLTLVSFACALVACKHNQNSNGAGSATPGSAVAGSATGSSASATPDIAPEARARAFLEDQLSKTGDRPAFLKTFAPDCTVLAKSFNGKPEDIQNFGLGEGGLDGAAVAKLSIKKLVAGGTPDVVWFYAELTGAGPLDIRAVELLAASAQWKPVAASFGTATGIQPSGDNSEIGGATGSDGPLTKLLVSPSALGAQLAPDAIVLGPKADQVGKTAADLASFKIEPVKPYQRAREIDQPTWGLAQLAYDHPDSDPTLTDRGLAQAFAVKKPDGSWSVVLVEYRSN